MGLAAVLFAVVLWPAGAGATCGNFDAPASPITSQQFTLGSVQRQDTPNDPTYDQAEPDTCQPNTHPPRSTNFYDERYELFGFPSALTAVTAVYKDGPNATKPMVTGFNASGAWKAERGRRDVTVAILDTGIKWDAEGLRTKVHLNTGELPLPQVSGPSLDPSVNCANYNHPGYDPDGDGGANVLDYACDPRVSVTWSGRTGPAGKITAQDLIHRYGHCQIVNHTIGPQGCPPDGSFDNDGNGYANDIAGWNFFDNNNDPTDLSSYFAASNHGTGRAHDAAERGNDSNGSIGVCPGCEFVPMRVWDTFVADANNFALAMLYSADNGVKVIEGADGGLYHSAFAERASQYAYDHGAVQTYSGDDLNTANHNYPANYSHAMLIQGTVPDTQGLGQGASNELTLAAQREGIGTNATVQTFFRGANTTQFGAKSSISMTGPTGSYNTGQASGAAGLVISAGLNHTPTLSLSPDETRELLEQTAERATTGNTLGAGTPDQAADPSAPADKQWTSHFGWGRADIGRAVGAVEAGNIPPEAAISSPDWFAPLTADTLRITGLARALRRPTGAGCHWKLMWGPGFPPQTTPNTWHDVPGGEGDCAGTTTDFGSIDLNAVRTALSTYVTPLDPGGPVFSTTSPNPFAQQFTVQLEVSEPGNPGVMTGIDRRVFTTFKDPTLRPGYPKRMGTGGEAPIRYADLNGDNVPELIVPTEDGKVHAYEPDGTELPGWPVQTQEQASAHGHEGAPGITALGPPGEPPRGPVIADLSGSGHPDVITAAGTHIYAWHGDGTPVAGFPVSSRVPGSPNPFCGPSPVFERQDLHHAKCGFLATPAVAHLEGYDKPLDIVAPSLDGHLYGFHADGTAVPGYPVALVDPNVPPDQQMIAESINEPAIGALSSPNHDDIVVADNEEYGAPPSGNDVSFGGALAGAKGGSTRLYAIDGSTGKFLPGWPVALPGVIQGTLPLIGPGHDPAIANIGGQPRVVASETGGDLATYNVAGSKLTTMQQQTYGPGSNAKGSVDNGALNLFESASVGDLQGTGTPDIVKYHVSLNQAANLLLVGQNAPYYHLIGAFDGSSGAPLPNYPTITEDYQFLSASNIAKMVPGPTNQILAGTGLGLLHAYDGATGVDPPGSGFPKQTGGWLFAPAAISSDGRMADITREGYLFEWQTSQPPCQSEWPSFRHDPHSSGNYNHDGTPPDAPSNLTLTALGADRYHLSFISPGNDGRCGTAAAYLAQVDGQAVDLKLAAPVAGGTVFGQDITLPVGAHTLAIQARDAAGNVGAPGQVAVPGSSGGEPGPSNSPGPFSPALGPLLRPAAPSSGNSPANFGPSLGLPSTARCASGRGFVIHLHGPHGQRLRSARIYVNDQRVKVLRGRRLRTRVNLKGLPGGTFTVRVVARTRRGRVLRTTRTYHTCTGGRSARGRRGRRRLARRRHRAGP